MNLVFILTDNHGAWTVGCYGNKDVQTPSIDKLAADGMRFTRALSSNPVCSPTRATYLTGLIPSQHGIHSYLPPEKPGTNVPCAIGEFGNLPRILHDAGYVCGLSGKWHLGGNYKPQVGFSDWITMPSGHTTTFYDAEVIEDGKLRKEPTYLTDLWTEHGVRFIEKNKDRPFFLYLAYNGPYGLGPSLNHPARNRWGAYYADKQLLSFPRDSMHPWQNANKQFLNNIVSIRRVAAEVSGVDDGVGRIMDTLHRLGLDDNTLVVFAGDQGWMGGQNGIWGMGDHLRPIGAFELMMHVPLIFRLPGKIPAGKTTDIFVSNYDFLPSVLSVMGLAEKMPRVPKSPGRDYSAVLRGETIAWDNEIFYEMENVRAIREQRWKYVERHPDGPHELYDMQTDPHERVNLYGEPRQKEVQAEMAKRLAAFFAKYVDPQYDVWNGGRSKARRLGQGAKAE
jgi:arylsulfatase A-like enzyme